MSKKDRSTKTGRSAALIDGVLHLDGIPECKMSDPLFVSFLDDPSIKAIRIVSLEKQWTEKYWLDGVGFQTAEIRLDFTIRKEIRSKKIYWYAYRKTGGIQAKRYMGMSEQVEPYQIARVASKLP